MSKNDSASVYVTFSNTNLCRDNAGNPGIEKSFTKFIQNKLLGLCLGNNIFPT